MLEDMSVVRPWLAAGACSLVLAGCGDGTSPAATEEPTMDETSSAPTPDPTTPTSPVARSVDDLASSLGVDPGEVEVVAVEEVTWRDGSRGCAQPGMSYTQALTDGSRITLR